MTRRERGDIIVVGGGIIGVAAALRLQLAEYRVVLVDRADPGVGCSYGNAGVIATSFVLPLSSPRHILAAPQMLLNPLGPLAVRLGDLPALAPWLARFLINAAPARQRRTIAGLQALNGRALGAWRSLLGATGDRAFLQERGMLDIARDSRDAKSLRAAAARLRAAGVAVRDLGEAEVAELEPVLAGRAQAGVLHEDAAHVSDPFALTRTLVRRFAEAGGRVVRAEVRRIAPSGEGVVAETSSGAIEASRAVIAAGYGAAGLLAPLGLRVPIGIEHGYHLMLPTPGVMPTRPVGFHAESFLATPMLGGLRLAGTVELAKAGAPPNWARADQLLLLAQRYFPDLCSDAASRWHGGRPSFPDSLPAIGHVPDAPQLVYAFGHQHLGLTQAAITSECVCDLVTGIRSPLSLEPFSLDRFAKGARASAA